MTLKSNNKSESKRKKTTSTVCDDSKASNKRKKMTFTRKVKDFILDKMSEGFDIAQIASKWPDQVPHAKSIYRKAVDDQEFAEEINQAYTILLMHRMDELHAISHMTASEAYPELDWREAEATLKRRIDEAKFVLGKMAPILSKRFDKAQKIEVEGNNLGPQLVIMNYGVDAPNSLLKDVTPAAEQITDK